MLGHREIVPKRVPLNTPPNTKHAAPNDLRARFKI